MSTIVFWLISHLCIACDMGVCSLGFSPFIGNTQGISSSYLSLEDNWITLFNTLFFGIKLGPTFFAIFTACHRDILFPFHTEISTKIRMLHPRTLVKIDPKCLKTPEFWSNRNGNFPPIFPIIFNHHHPNAGWNTQDCICLILSNVTRN